MTQGTSINPAALVDGPTGDGVDEDGDEPLRLELLEVEFPKTVVVPFKPPTSREVLAY
jgi:hypothetical protein